MVTQQLVKVIRPHGKVLDYISCLELDVFQHIIDLYGTLPYGAAQTLQKPSAGKLRELLGKQTISVMATDLLKERTSNPFEKPKCLLQK